MCAVVCLGAAAVDCHMIVVCFFFFVTGALSIEVGTHAARVARRCLYVILNLVQLNWNIWEILELLDRQIGGENSLIQKTSSAAVISDSLEVRIPRFGRIVASEKRGTEYVNMLVIMV